MDKFVPLVDYAIPLILLLAQAALLSALSVEVVHGLLRRQGGDHG